MTTLPESLRKAAVKACPWASEHSAFSGRNDVQYHDEWMDGVRWLWQHWSEEIAAAKYNYDHDTSNARTMAKRIAELEAELKAVNEHMQVAQTEQDHLRAKITKLEAKK